jgi:hypothetical protein
MLSDLVAGKHVVIFRNGSCLSVIQGSDNKKYFFGSEYMFPFDKYNEDMISLDNNKNLDVMTVFVINSEHLVESWSRYRKEFLKDVSFVSAA